MSHSHYDRDFVWGFSRIFQRIPSRNPYHERKRVKKRGEKINGFGLKHVFRNNLSIPFRLFHQRSSSATLGEKSAANDAIEAAMTDSHNLFGFGCLGKSPYYVT